MSRRTPSFKRVVVPVLGGLAATALVATSNIAGATPTDQASADADKVMGTAFAEAAQEYDVPRDLLVAVGYGESRLTDHDGKPSQANGYGVMHLVSNPSHTTLKEAAELTGESSAELKKDVDANIHGAAAVLRDYADAAGLKAGQRQDLGAWFEPVARYSGADSSTARLYADTVYELLAEGVKTSGEDGESITVGPRDVEPDRGDYAKVAPYGSDAKSDDYPPAAWVPADSSNYTGGRSGSISTIVVHVTQGAYAGAISWFQNPEANVSAHYVIRSSDGEVTQMVRDADTAWHARDANGTSIGLEHEGFVDDPAWFTDAMYRSSAELTKHLAETHGIPKNRDSIVGHNEVPGNDHGDPGPNWDWGFYMSLVNG